MKTLLRIDSSLRKEESFSRRMGDYLVAHWKKLHPDGKILERDVNHTVPPHLTHETFLGFYDDSKQTETLNFSDTLIEELFQSDDILITIPMYNFGMPSSLKAYFDLVVRYQRTFSYAGGATGLLQNKKAYVVCAMGGKKKVAGELSIMEQHVQRILSYIGITNVVYHTVDGTADDVYITEQIPHHQQTILNILNQ